MKMAGVHVSDHPLCRHKLSLLRDRSTAAIQFRMLVDELSFMLTYEAIRDLELNEIQVETPLTTTRGHDLRHGIGLVPILRAGLGMVGGALRLLPQAQVWHLGLARNERTLDPEEYYNNLPATPTVGRVIVLDPMLATGGSAGAAIDILARWGVERIQFVGILAAPEGVESLRARHPGVDIHVGAVDERLTTADDGLPPGFIWPGLGDAGDRQFDTVA